MDTSPAPLLRVRGLTKRYGEAVALAETDLDVAAQEFVTLLGPSGCGKSTLLRMLAGITPASAGTVELSGRRIDELPPDRRDVAMVFQSYALFPHMNVRKNLNFGLRMKKLPAAEQERRMEHAIGICGLGSLVERMPRQLSGGQQQRVALARAIVMQPALLLFDEPLSNLDAKLREQLREELVKLHRRIGATSLYVTHDQAEAMAMSDRIVVMNAGRVVESGTPIDLYRRPRHEFTARFLGQTNLLRVPTEQGVAHLPWGQRIAVDGLVGPWNVKREVTISLRPEDVRLAAPEVGFAGMPVRIESVNFAGAQAHYTVRVGDTHVRATSMGAAELFAVGQAVEIAATANLQALRGEVTPL